MVTSAEELRRNQGMEEKIHRSGITNQVFRNEYLAQQAEYGFVIRNFENDFGQQLDKAFEKLVGMTTFILGCTNEELDAVVLNQHSSDALKMVRDALAEFHTLRIDADVVLHEQSEYSQLVTAKENKYYSFEDEIQKIQTSLRLELEATQQSLQIDLQDFMTDAMELNGYLTSFKAYDNLSGFEQFFVSDPRDKWQTRHDNLVNIVMGSHDKIEAKKALVGCLNDIENDLNRIYKELDEEYRASQKLQNCVIEAKSAAAEIFSKVYDMEVALTSPDISLCVEDAARHILQLTSISVKMIDEDPEVKDFKAAILTEMEKKYGMEQLAELRKEKKYLEF